MNLRVVPILSILTQLAACAAPGTVDERRMLHHIGAEGTGCDEESGPDSIRLEDLPEEGVFRITNPRRQAVRFYYDDWSGYAMFFIRFRDASGSIIAMDGPGDCGWWSSKFYSSDLWEYGEWPRRRELRIPGLSSITIKRDPAALLAWSHHEKAEKSPCQMQVKLFGYPGRRTWRSMAAVGQWGPSPCPGRAAAATGSVPNQE